MNALIITNLRGLCWGETKKGRGYYANCQPISAGLVWPFANLAAQPGLEPGTK
jgi:hypothetical protein